jgi:GxxExxY protein
VELLHKEITEPIIGAAFEVYRVLGYGFLEKVYQRAMQVEVEMRGLVVDMESAITVWFKGKSVGDYYADLFVNQCVIAELKVAKEYESKATSIKVGLPINFGRTKVEFKRLVF